MHILPAVDMRGGRCVRLLQGDYSKETVYSDNPASQAEKWSASGAGMLHLVDLDGAKAGHIVNGDVIRNICSSVRIPCELGGGIRTTEDAKKAFDLGVARVILGTAACEEPRIAESFIALFGADKIVAGIDAKNGMTAVRGWIENSGVPALALAEKLHSFGINRIIYTDIATDGTLKGPNFGAIRDLCALLPDCSVIASGGISSADDVRRFAGFKLPNLEGVIVGKALYDGRVTLEQLNDAAKGGDHV